MDLTGHWVGFAAVGIFVTAYLVVIAEEFTELRKSKPMMLAAGAIWALIAAFYVDAGQPEPVHRAVEEFLLEYVQLFLFLLVAMTYVNAMSERRTFDALRAWLLRSGLGYRALFWVTGTLAFFLSAVLDNLTTALVMCAVILAIGRDNPRFVAVSCVNIVVAANAGGVFSPFGDITSLMVWQAGMLPFLDFFALFLPAVANYLVPAALMTLALDNGRPESQDERVSMKRGGGVIIVLFACTIVTAIGFHHSLHLPPALGMMTGLAYLKFFGYYLQRTHVASAALDPDYGTAGDVEPFDSFREVSRVEWDTLFFFFGVIMCVGGLGFLGYLAHLSEYLYVDLGATVANTAIGALSAVVDNIPLMVAVLQMEPDMDRLQWLLVTLTAGVGGSMLSIGSAAGVALMGQARGVYTFFVHLRWTPAIALGYALGIWVHLTVNAAYAGIAPGR
jgi:Na+/H+ antiporter NhaD/arsenite permease-like protein